MNDTLKQARNSSSFMIFFSSLKMASATLLSRLLGLVREQAMAAIFGASGITDAFLVAYRIPNMLRDLFAEGAFSPAFVPIFTEAQESESGQEKARHLLWSMFVILLVSTTILSLAMIIWAPELIALFAPKFQADPSQFSLAVTLLRIMSPFLICVSLAALFMGALNCFKIFFVPALAPAFFNLVMLATLWFVVPLLSSYHLHPGLALGLGVIGGGIAQTLIQLPFLWKVGLSPVRPRALFPRHIFSYIKRIVSRISVGFLGIAATQINLLITTIIASGMATGTISWLIYAFRLFQFPVGLLGVSISGSNLVYFSEAWKRGEKDKAISYLHASYRLCLFLMIPAMAILLALSHQSVHLIFERGAFGAKDTQMTTLAFRCYLMGLPFYGLYKIFTSTLYSLGSAKIPVTISIVSIAFNIFFCLVFAPRWGPMALALGTALSMLLNAFLQATFIRRILQISWTFFLDRRIIIILVAGAGAWWVCQHATNWLWNPTDSFGPKILAAGFLTLGGLAAYLAILILFGELKTIKTFVTNQKKG